MQIRFSPSAEKDIEEIFTYLKIENPELAKHTISIIKNQVEGLLEFPHKGRPGLAGGTRELIIPKLPYSIPYEVYQDTIYILRIYHTSRMPVDLIERD